MSSDPAFHMDYMNQLDPPAFESEVCQHSKECCEYPMYYDEKKDRLLCAKHAKEADEEYYEEFLEGWREYNQDRFNRIKVL